MVLGEWVKDVLRFVYPGCCQVCSAYVPEDGPLCPTCLGELETLEAAPACGGCGLPVAYEAAPCPHCLGRGLRPFSQVARLGIFDGPLRELVHALKYKQHWAAGELLAERLLAHAPAREMLRRAEVLVPVPLHWWRAFRRGYNQSDVLARALRVRGQRVAAAVARVRDTASQTQMLNRAQRTENVKGAFVLLDAKHIAGRHVVVVDDVTTTGATLREVGRQLLSARPASLGAVVCAVADPKGRPVKVNP